MPSKICLFSAHSPKIGGGAVILRSLVDNCHTHKIIWTFIGPERDSDNDVIQLGEGFMNKAPFNAILNTFLMLSGFKLRKIDSVVQRLLMIECDSYWIVSHNEGLAVANQLSRNKLGRKVHLTIHDDWAGALCNRSKRYRLFSSIAKRFTGQVLKNVSSFDVISLQMAIYYQKLYGREGMVCHRYIPMYKLNEIPKKTIRNQTEFSIGHLGSLYDIAELLSLLRTLKLLAERKGIRGTLNTWGTSLPENSIPVELKDFVVFHKNEDEYLVIQHLRRCEILYAMYPFGRRYNVFAKTSLPTKISTYIISGKPILGHSPDDSTISHLLKVYDLGLNWSNVSEIEGASIIRELLRFEINSSEILRVRDKLFGETNLQLLDIIGD